MPVITDAQVHRLREYVAEKEAVAAKKVDQVKAYVERNKETLLKVTHAGEVIGGVAAGSYVRGRWTDPDGKVAVFGFRIPPDLLAGALLAATGISGVAGKGWDDHLINLGVGFVGSYAAGICQASGAAARARVAGQEYPNPGYVGYAGYPGYQPAIAGVPTAPELMGPVPAYGGPATYHRPSYRVGGPGGPMTDSELAAYAAGHF